MHFKLIFAPKVVYEEFTPRKAELIIRENQPIKLPPDVAKGKNNSSRFSLEKNTSCYYYKCHIIEKHELQYTGVF